MTTRKTPPAIPFAKGADPSKARPKVTPEEVRARLRDSLNVPNPAKAAPLAAHEYVDGQRVELPALKIQPYDRNPRRAGNESYPEIRASLQATGPGSLDLMVTRRPGEELYMPYRGGNTRLAAVHDLLAEGDQRFERIIVTYKCWVSEADTLAQHLIENNNRADMTFWDKATAYLVDMKQEIQAEQGGDLSLRKYEEELSKRGIGLKKSHLSLFQFAVDRFTTSGIGPYLTATQALQLQPAVNQLSKLATRMGINESHFQGLLDRVCSTLVESAQTVGEGVGIRAEAILDGLRNALAEDLGASQEDLLTWMDALSRFPEMSAKDLRESVATLPPSPPQNGSRKGKQASNAPSSATHPPHAREDAAPGSPDTPPPPSPVNLLEACQLLSQATGLMDILVPDAGVPSGFFMEIPNEALDLTQQAGAPASRIVAWQLLALVSGQWDRETCNRLPTNSKFRKLRLAEGGLDPNALPLLAQDHLLVDINSTSLAEDLGWGVSIPINWMATLLSDPQCLGAVSGIFAYITNNTPREAV